MPFCFLHSAFCLRCASLHTPPAALATLAGVCECFMLHEAGERQRNKVPDEAVTCAQSMFSSK